MALFDGWRRVRNWLIQHQPAFTTVVARAVGARSADTQPQAIWYWEPFSALQTMDEPQQSVAATPTQVDQFGRYGLVEWEVRCLVEWSGSVERLTELLSWVGKAHKRLEMLEFPNFGSGEISIAALRAAHPKAIAALATLLRQIVTVREASVDQIRTLLAARLPGLVFPKAGGSRAELDEFISVARTLNAWLAVYGTHPCGCPALPEPLDIV